MLTLGAEQFLSKAKRLEFLRSYFAIDPGLDGDKQITL